MMTGKEKTEQIIRNKTKQVIEDSIKRLKIQGYDEITVLVAVQAVQIDQLQRDMRFAYNVILGLVIMMALLLMMSLRG